MKKTIAVLLTLVMVFCLFASCAKSEKKAAETPVTMEEQFDKTGVRLILPEGAENPAWFVYENEAGVPSSKATFGYNGFEFTYKAEKSDAEEPYDFSGLGYEWSDEASWGYDDREGYVETNEQGGYVAWLEAGYAFIIYADGVTEEDIYNVADGVYDAEFVIAQEEADGNFGEEDIVGDDVSDLSGWMLAENLWKYEEEDRYIRISANKTYVECGADRTPDGKVRFWTPDPEDESKVILYDENGKEKDVLTVTGDGEFCMMTDSEGKMLSVDIDVMNGTYDFYASPEFCQDGQLYVVTFLKPWVSDQFVSGLKKGDVLSFADTDIYDVEVETFEKKDGTVTVNGEWVLEFDPAAGAWLVKDFEQMPMEAIGVGFIDEDTVFTDSCDTEPHTDPEECIASHEGAFGTLTVKDGMILNMEITSAN